MASAARVALGAGDSGLLVRLRLFASVATCQTPSVKLEDSFDTSPANVHEPELVAGRAPTARSQTPSVSLEDSTDTSPVNVHEPELVAGRAPTARSQAPSVKLEDSFDTSPDGCTGEAHMTAVHVPRARPLRQTRRLV